MRSYSPRASAIGIDVARPPGERYRILGQIATGGMAEIYLGRMRTKQGAWREVVIKRLTPELQKDEEFVQMFYDEARIASQLHHEGIVEIFELGELENSLFIAMEAIRGVNLQDLHNRLLARKRRMPPALALEIGRGVLEALEYAHAMRDSNGRPLHLVHRDLSPHNIIVSYAGRVKLVDFGVAKAEGRLHKTRVGMVKGKYAYMSPEQINGDPIDARADLFALGEVLFLLLVGHHPFQCENEMELLTLVLEGRALEPRKIDPAFPPDLAALLACALQSEPDHRFRDARAMLDGLLAVMRAQGQLTTIDTLGRFVRASFEDRLRLEEAARAAKDDAKLVESMRVGPREGEEPARNPVLRRPFDPVIMEPEGSIDLEPGELDDPTRAEPLDEVLPEEELTRGGAQEDSQTARAADPVFDDHTEASAEDFSVEPTVIDPGARAAAAEALNISNTSNTSNTLPPPPRMASGANATLGQYEIVKRIGRGSMAEVFLAHHRGAHGFQKPVALKCILPHLATEKRFLEMFFLEARLAGRLAHPNVVQILDVGSAEGRHFIAMEYVEGWDLEKVLERARAAGVELPVRLGCRLMGDVCAGLAAAHGALDDEGVPLRIIHRDVVPQNVLLSTKGAVKLTDFGIAKAAESVGFTRTGEIRGRAAYTAPELLAPALDGRGAPQARAHPDERCDIFSAGAVLFEVLAGRPLFVRSTAFETMLAAERDPIPAPSSIRPEVSKELDAITARALARKPAERYQSAAVLQIDLERAAAKLKASASSAQLASWLEDLFAGTEASAEGLQAGARAGVPVPVTKVPAADTELDDAPDPDEVRTVMSYELPPQLRSKSRPGH